MRVGWMGNNFRSWALHVIRLCRIEIKEVRFAIDGFLLSHVLWN